MSDKFYIDIAGNYLGNYQQITKNGSLEENPALPQGAIEVNSLPYDVNQKYNPSSQEWEYDLLYIKNLKIQEIKREAKRRILEVYPEYRQRNILMSQTDADISVMNSAISNIRTLSNNLESNLNSLTLDQLVSFDPSNNNNWN